MDAKKPDRKDPDILNSVARKGKKSKMTRTLDRNGQLALMRGARSGNSARQNFRSFRDKAAKLCYIFVIDVFHSVNTKSANLFAAFSCASAVRS